MYSWEKFHRQGALACPVTRQKLSFDSSSNLLTSEDKQRQYPVLAGKVPLLLQDQKAVDEYLSDTHMVELYEQIKEEKETRQQKPLLKKLKDGFISTLDRNFSSGPSRSVFRDALEKVNGESLSVSIGGGPKRDHPYFQNLNIAPFVNVDIVADAHSLPYADNSLDFIFTSAVLEHLQNPGASIREIHRVLKPGARVFSKVPFMGVYHGFPHHYRNFTLTGHEYIFKANRFSVLESGTDVGPTHALVTANLFYIREYFPWLLIKPMGFVLNFIGYVVIGKLDAFLDKRDNSHAMAATTYVLAEKH